MRNRKQKIDTSRLTYASILEFNNEDTMLNKTDNFQLRCTFRGNVAGVLSKDNEGSLVFLDIIDDESFGYPYFNKVSDAERDLSDENKELFVMNSNPLREIGITGKLTKEELEEKLRKTGLYFNFMDDELEQNHSLVKK